MILQILLFFIGLSLILIGANSLVDGSSSLAKKMGVSEFVIGLTIIGIGTSAPEMVVSLIGSVKGNADIAVGNVLGSNIFNALIILGVTSFIFPMQISDRNKKKDIPFLILTTLLVIVLGINHTLFGLGKNSLDRIDGIVLLLLFVFYIINSFRIKNDDQPDSDQPIKLRKTGVSVIMILLGIGALVLGGNLFVDSAVNIAKYLHVSDKFIAITILAVGTSLPEFATSIIAATKKRGQMALGNVIGSNMFNLLWILGCSSVIHPLSFDKIMPMDLIMLLLSAVVILTSAFMFKKKQIDKFDGMFFLAIYGCYFVWLVMNN